MRTSRLGYGAFSAVGFDNPTTWDARRVFLEKIQDLAPEVLHQLRVDVLPLYKVNPDVDTFLDQAPSTMLQSLMHLKATPHPTRSPRFDDALNAWLTRFNLDEEWVIDSVFRTLLGWAGGMALSQWIHYVPIPQSSALTEDERRFGFEHPGWLVGPKHSQCVYRITDTQTDTRSSSTEKGDSS